MWLVLILAGLFMLPVILVICALTMGKLFLIIIRGAWTLYGDLMDRSR